MFHMNLYQVSFLVISQLIALIFETNFPTQIAYFLLLVNEKRRISMLYYAFYFLCRQQHLLIGVGLGIFGVYPIFCTGGGSVKSGNNIEIWVALYVVVV